jgi:hypothetical protein
VERAEGARLVAVWIDSEMRAFEKEREVEKEESAEVSEVTDGGEEGRGGCF